jgi:hypothetical protein
VLECGSRVLPTLYPPSYRGRDRELAFQATLHVQPADKRLSLVLKIGLVLDTSLIERFDSDKDSNLLARKSCVLELPLTCLSGRVTHYGWELPLEFHDHPPVSASRPVRLYNS